MRGKVWRPYKTFSRATKGNLSRIKKTTLRDDSSVITILSSLLSSVTQGRNEIKTEKDRKQNTGKGERAREGCPDVTHNGPTARISGVQMLHILISQPTTHCSKLHAFSVQCESNYQETQVTIIHDCMCSSCLGCRIKINLTSKCKIQLALSQQIQTHQTKMIYI